MTITAESLALSIANFRTQMLSSLADPSADTGASFGDILSQLQAGSDTSATTGSGIDAVLSAGSDSTLGAPVSGQAVLARISSLDVAYKAQYSELSQMESWLPQLQTAAQQLGAVAGSGASDGIKTQLQNFADQYNAWVQKFNPDVQQGGVLANTQAADVSLYELKQAITNPFIGANDGFRGLSDLGIDIDPTTNLMSVDTPRLDAALASNKQAVSNAVGDFSANFAKSASLLASDGNFVRNRLDNLDGAITFIDGNATDLQKVLGSGDAANPASQLAQALAAYKNTMGI
jgi:hypothetical protein